MRQSVTLNEISVTQSQLAIYVMTSGVASKTTSEIPVLTNITGSLKADAHHASNTRVILEPAGHNHRLSRKRYPDYQENWLCGSDLLPTEAPTMKPSFCISCRSLD